MAKQTQYMKGLTHAEKRWNKHHSVWLLTEDLQAYQFAGRIYDGSKLTEEFESGFMDFIKNVKGKKDGS